MSICSEILEILENNKGKFISGTEMAHSLNVSRNAVWKAVKALQKNGHDIKAITNKGYVLNENSSVVSAQSIAKYIRDKRIRVQFEDCVSSTNTLLKEYAEKGENEGLLLVAAEQTQGKGRLGRTFSSQRGTGIYFSLLLRPDLSPSDSLLITTCAAVAVSKAIMEIACKDSEIKWVNDIYMNDRKVCGILTQAAFDLEGNKLAYAVLGIGINIYFPENTLPCELEGIAGAVFDKSDLPCDAVSRLVAETINIFMEEYGSLTDKKFLDHYRAHSYLDGKKISVIKSDGVYNATAIGINEDLSLSVCYENGNEERLFTGEVSTKVK